MKVLTNLSEHVPLLQIKTKHFEFLKRFYLQFKFTYMWHWFPYLIFLTGGLNYKE